MFQMRYEFIEADFSPQCSLPGLLLGRNPEFLHRQTFKAYVT